LLCFYLQCISIFFYLSDCFLNRSIILRPKDESTALPSLRVTFLSVCARPCTDSRIAQTQPYGRAACRETRQTHSFFFCARLL